MNPTVDSFVQLGRQLANFGSDAASRTVIQDAQRVNGWFEATDIRRAIEAIRTQMLDPERLHQWLADYPTLPVRAAKNVLVITAGNIPLVGFFDLLCVLASGHRCLLKPAAKDTPLTDYILTLLREIKPNTPIEIYDDNQTPDAVIATGSDNTNRYFRSHYAGIPSLLRGSRQSVAVLDGTERHEQLTALSNDIFAYSGLGCRNVSLVFLPQGSTLRLTPPAMSPKYRNNYRQTRALLTMAETPFIDLGEAVAVEERVFPHALSRINYSDYSDSAEVAAWLAEHDRELQCVVTESLLHPRSVSFGAAQSPTLTDYPDAADVLKFLAQIG